MFKPKKKHFSSQQKKQTKQPHIHILIANQQSSYIREGESINTNVTCPGATVALGLIYFNSGDRPVSDWFAPPDSAFSLDSIRPDFLLLRTIARNLIMWKHVLPTQKWVLSQLSNILKGNVRSCNVSK
jgi:anaphase-promoting complex subunit 1